MVVSSRRYKDQTRRRTGDDLFVYDFSPGVGPVRTALPLILRLALRLAAIHPKDSLQRMAMLLACHPL